MFKEKRVKMLTRMGKCEEEEDQPIDRSHHSPNKQHNMS